MKVAIIGSGIGGLVSALRVAEQCDVTLFESAPVLGGKIGFVEHLGVRCDTGPSVITMLDTIESLGLNVRLRSSKITTLYRWPDGTEIRLGGGVESMLRAIEDSFGAASRSEFAAFLKYATGIWNAVAPAFVYASAPSLKSLSTQPIRQLKRLRSIDALRSMQRAIVTQVSNRYLRDVLLRFATYNGSDPRVAPATLNCIAHVELVDGGAGLQGGFYGLVDALADALTVRGVALKTGSRVDTIQIEDGRVRGVVVNDRRMEFDAVVSNADVSHLRGTLLGEPAPKHEPSMSGWNALTAVKPDLFPDAHTVLFPNDYSAEFEDIFDHRRLPQKPTVYVCNQSVAHGVTFPDGTAPAFLMINAPAGCEASSKEGLDVVQQQLHSFGLSIPDPFWIRTPSDLAAQFPGSAGAIYGASSNSRFAAFRRAPNRDRSISGLYLAGGSAHPGGGVPMCILSGEHAARALLDNLT